jgi:hypothetical protein
MEVNNSTVSGNIQAIDNLLEQGGILNPDEIADEEYNPEFDVTEFIVLMHGDLGTGERIQSIRQRRSIEESEYERKQMVYFCPGLFHCKMACVDTLHRMLIKPNQSKRCFYVSSLRSSNSQSVPSLQEGSQSHKEMGHGRSVQTAAIVLILMWEHAIVQLA